MGQIFTNNRTGQGSDAIAGKTAAENLMENMPHKLHPSIIYNTHTNRSALLCWSISFAENFLGFHHLIPDYVGAS